MIFISFIVFLFCIWCLINRAFVEYFMNHEEVSKLVALTYADKMKSETFVFLSYFVGMFLLLYAVYKKGIK